MSGLEHSLRTASSLPRPLTNLSVPSAGIRRRAAHFPYKRILALAAVVFTLAIASPCAHAQSAAHFNQVMTLGGGFAAPWGLAVDADGNVYVADISHNTVTKMTAGCMSFTCMTTLGGGFSAPIGVAVDSGGNVYVTDSGNHAVKEIPAGCTSSACVTTLSDGFAKPYGIAVDGSGNVYVADGDNRTVERIPAGCASSACVTPLAGGYKAPTGVAVDDKGNVYVTDIGDGQWVVKEIPAGCTSTTCMEWFGTAALYDPSGVAVDRSGNIWVGDPGQNAVIELPPGCQYYPCERTLGGVNRPQGMAVDAHGNIYVAETASSHAVKEIMLNGVNFFSVAVGSSSLVVPLAFTFDSAGTIQAPAVLTQGAAKLDFIDAGGGTCTTNGVTHSYNTGNTCTVYVKFRPKYAEARYGAVVLKNASGNPIATAYVYGTGVGPQAVFSPSTIRTLGGICCESAGVAVDGGGNVYVANFGHSALMEVPAGCTSSACVTTLGGNFGNPTGVAVDGGGNVYVAEPGSTVVERMPPGCTSPACVTTMGGGFFRSYGVAADGSGNVYVADAGNSKVKYIPAGCTSSVCVKTLGGGFSSPVGVAVDSSGNVYVADSGQDEVKVMPAGCASSACVTRLGGGFHYLGYIAVDGSGSVYTADSGGLKYMPSGCVSSTCVTALGGDSSPGGVAVDGSGNVYAVSNDAVWKVIEIERATPPSLNFASTETGKTSSDSPQSVMVANVGNAPLEFAIPSAGFNPSVPAEFAWDNASTCEQTGSGAATAFSLAPAASCNIAIDFEPTTERIFTDKVVLTDNNGNASAAAQQIPVSGVGTTQPLMISPAPGSILGGPTTFTWAPHSGVTSFQVYIGTAGAGSHDLYWGPNLAGTATSSASVNIPIKGAALSVRLWYQLSGYWIYQDYTYQEATPPSITSPSTSTVLGGLTKFNWNPGVGSTGFQIYVGTTGTGSHNIYWGPDLPGSATSSASIPIPVLGANLAVRLSYLIGNSWYSQDYAYTEATPPAMSSPQPGSALGGLATFTWSLGNGVSGYQIYAGSTGAGSSDIYRGPDLSATTTSSASILIPTNGATVYVRLWYLVNAKWLSNDYTYTVANLPYITSPEPRSVLGGPTAFTWNPGPGASGFQLYVGSTGPGSHDVYMGSILPGSATYTGSINIPVTGGTLYVRLMYLANSTWQYQDYTYRDALAPSMFEPLTTSRIAGPTSFEWHGGFGAKQYQVYVGTTGAGSHDIYCGPDVTVTSSQVNIPANGAALYVRLWYVVNNSWLYADYAYTEATAPSITSPSTSTLLGGQTTFTWSLGAGVSNFQLGVGTTGAGSSNLYLGPVLAGTVTSSAPIDIPDNGTPIYVRLWYVVNLSWLHQDYTYTETTAPAINYPLITTLLGGPTQFTWNPGVSVSSYQVYIGTTGPGSRDFYWGPDLAATATSTPSIDIPVSGAALYVRLWYEKSSSWLYQDYTYKEATPPSITSPSTSTLLGDPTTFTWNPGAGATGFQFAVGTTGAGSSNLYLGPILAGTATSSPSIHIPTNGATLYVRLSYRVSATWYYEDYVYTAANLPYMTSPAPGTAIMSPTIFTWSPGQGVAQFELYVGSTGPGSRDVYWGPDLPGTATSSVPVTIPYKGATLYVRLWYEANGSWLYRDYTYTELLAPSISPPTSTLLGGPTNFCWSNPGYDMFGLEVGTTGPGSHDIYNGSSPQVQTCSISPINIPVNGATVYVRLLFHWGPEWPYEDFVYTEATAPSMLTPTPGSTIGGPTVFTWDPGHGISAFQVTTASILPDETIYNGPQVSASTTSTPSINIPTGGDGAIYFYLDYVVNGNGLEVGYMYLPE